jgi:alpha-tubulin suppressor-like RCC1 family protein
MNHTCGIKSDNKLYCWGDNQNGQLGNEENTAKNVPTKVGDDDWIEITAGLLHNCGIKADKKLYCWGDNTYGSIGDGTSGTQSTPVLVEK